MDCCCWLCCDWHTPSGLPVVVAAAAAHTSLLPEAHYHSCQLVRIAGSDDE